MDERIKSICLAFECVKQNWSKGGSFQSLVDLICQSIGVESTKEIYELLKKSDALWLNNHLDDPGDDASEEETEQITTIKTVHPQMTQAHTDKKNHDFH